MLYYVHQLKCDLNIYILKLKTESYLDRKQGLWKQSRSWENQKNELKGAERRPSVASGDNSTRVHHMSNVLLHTLIYTFMWSIVIIKILIYAAAILEYLNILSLVPVWQTAPVFNDLLQTYKVF